MTALSPPKPVLSKLPKLEGTFYDKRQLVDHTANVSRNIEQLSGDPPNHGKIWNMDDTATLVLGVWCRLATADIAKILGRKRSSLYGRLLRIGVATINGNRSNGWESYFVSMSAAHSWLQSNVIRDGAWSLSWESIREDIRTGRFYEDIRTGRFYEDKVPSHYADDFFDAFRTQLAGVRPPGYDPYRQSFNRLELNTTSPFVVRIDDIDREVLTTLKNKEQIMSVPMIDSNVPVTKLTVVYGHELKSTPPATMLELIKRAEKQIAEYKLMNVKSVFIEQEVKAREEAITLLVSELDSRVK